MKEREKADLKMKMEIFSMTRLDSSFPLKAQSILYFLSIHLALFRYEATHSSSERSEIGKSWEKKNDVFDILIVVAADVASGGCGDKREVRACRGIEHFNIST